MDPRLEVQVMPASSSVVRPHPLLFVHGAWHAAWCWQPHFMPFFAAHGYECHALSLRGHGASEGRARLRYTRLQAFVSDVRRVAEELTTPPVIIGHSMGGLIVQMLLAQWRPAAAVLLCPYNRAANIRWIRELLPTNVSRVAAAFLRANPYLLVCDRDFAITLFFSEDLPRDRATGWADMLQTESYFALLELMAPKTPDPRAIQTPMLVACADQDALFDPEAGEAMARRYGADFEILHGLAHDAMLDTRWEEAARCLLSWFDARGL